MNNRAESVTEILDQSEDNNAESGLITMKLGAGNLRCSMIAGNSS